MADEPSPTPTPPVYPEPETVQHFMERIWTMDYSTISQDDWLTLVAIALEGSRSLVQQFGPTVPVPSAS